MMVNMGLRLVVSTRYLPVVHLAKILTFLLDFGVLLLFLPLFMFFFSLSILFNNCLDHSCLTAAPSSHCFMNFDKTKKFLWFQKNWTHFCFLPLSILKMKLTLEENITSSAKTWVRLYSHCVCGIRWLYVVASDPKHSAPLTLCMPKGSLVRFMDWTSF